MVRQVTDLPRASPNAEMSLFGMLIALPLVLLVLPILPFLALYWLYDKLTS